MIKPFLELAKLDLSSHTQKKPTFYKDKEGKMQKTSEDKWLDYIEWAKVLELLYANGAESVQYSSSIHETKPNTLRIALKIDGKDTFIDYPIIDGNTIITSPNQMQLHKAELRGFVKAVAIGTGLGLSLWQKDEQMNGETLSDTMPIKVNAKRLLMGAESEKELLRIWTSLNESEQVKFKSIFSQRKEMLQ